MCRNGIHRRFNCVCHARHQMTNHYHVLAETPEAEWLETDRLLGQLSKQRGRAVATYSDFVRGCVGLPSIWDGLKGA